MGDFDDQAFGLKRTAMQKLLSAHGLPDSVEIATLWVLLWKDDESPSRHAATWLDDGWTNVDAVRDALSFADDPKRVVQHLLMESLYRRVEIIALKRGETVLGVSLIGALNGERGTAGD